MPSPFVPERLGELRPCGLVPGRARRKIGSDARKVGRYEDGRASPSLETVGRIAGTFNTSVDYFVPPDASITKAKLRLITGGAS